jgi:hypothetical protein
MKGSIEIQQVYKFSIPVFIKINAETNQGINDL